MTEEHEQVEEIKEDKPKKDNSAEKMMDDMRAEFAKISVGFDEE